MLQSGGIDPRATAREALALHASFYRQPREVDELLALVELGPLGGARCRSLSGGERQRLALAIAIVGRPEVLLLDEPTAGMDPAARARTRDLVAGLRDEGAAVLLTTHDLADVERLADRLIIIAGGRVVAAGTPSEITQRAAPRVSFRLASPLAEQDRADLSGRLRAVVDDPGTGSYVVSAPASPGIVAEVTAWLAQRGLLVTELRAGAGTLEERYLELTAEDDRR
jgi:ABC-2 type transport system ATP-binding protein